MLTRSLPVAALLVLLAACTSSTAPVDTPRVVAGGYQLLKVNGRNTSGVDPIQYRYRNAGDPYTTLVQIETATVCVAGDGRFDFFRVMWTGFEVDARTIIEKAGAASGYVDARGLATIDGDVFAWPATILNNGRPVDMTARHSHDSLTVTIPSEFATYLLIEAGAGSPLRESCRAAGF